MILEVTKEAASLKTKHFTTLNYKLRASSLDQQGPVW